MDERPLISDSYNRAGAARLLERLAAGSLVMQGPLGSLLLSEHGDERAVAAWNTQDPRTVEDLHERYRLAGADILITNTFQASAPALKRDQVRCSVLEVNRAGVACARLSEDDLVLGSIGSCGLSWSPEDPGSYRAASDAYCEQAQALLASGADGLLLETFISRNEIDPAFDGVRRAADGMPFMASYAVGDDGTLLGDGTPLEDAVCYAVEEGAVCVGVNCCSLEAATAAVPRIVRVTDAPIMVRPNAGMPHRNAACMLAWDEDVQAFVLAAKEWIAAGAALVGGCCGTTERTVEALKELLRT